MRLKRYAFMVCWFGLAAHSHAQKATSGTYGTDLFAIPGTSAVAFAPTATLRGKPLSPSYKAVTATPTARMATHAPLQPQGAIAPADTVSRVAATGTTTADTAPDYLYPLAFDNHYGTLSQGLNVSMGLSVFSQFGKHARKGAGFSQNLAVTYLQPLGSRAWMAAGGYVNHTLWGGDSYTTGGLYAELGYRFNDHWAAYIYGRKEITSGGLRTYGYPYGYGMYHMHSPYPYHDLGDKLGAAVRWTPNPTLSVELSVEKNWYPGSGYGYNDRYKYNYPVPQK